MLQLFSINSRERLEELLLRDRAVLVDIKLLHETFALCGVEEDVHILESLNELSVGDDTVRVNVEAADQGLAVLTQLSRVFGSTNYLDEGVVYGCLDLS